MSDNRNCLIDVLKLIDHLQKCSMQQESFDNTCSRPFLGIGGNISYFNTRPITLFLCDNSQLELTYYVDGVPTTSNTFRVEDVNDSCVTLRLLAGSNGNYTATTETALVNINCICALRCLNDLSLDL